MLLNLFFTALLGVALITSCQKNTAEPPVPAVDSTKTTTGQYLNFGFDEVTNKINGDCITGCINGEFYDGKFYIRSSAPNRRVLDITIKNFPGKEGQYAFDSATRSSLEVTLGPGFPSYVANYSSCQSPYNVVNSDGAIHVTKWASKVNDYVEGSFNTILYPKGECGRGGKAITYLYISGETYPLGVQVSNQGLTLVARGVCCIAINEETHFLTGYIIMNKWREMIRQ